MNKNTAHKIGTITTIIAGLTACGFVLFLQGGGLVGSPNPPDALQAAVALSASATPAGSNLIPEPPAPPPPPKPPTSLDLPKMTVKVVRPKRTTVDGIARPYCKRQLTELGTYVTICDRKQRTSNEPDYKRSGGIVGDYSRDVRPFTIGE